jgi:RNA polymerase sporulation-specific sigma factor
MEFVSSFKNNIAEVEKVPKKEKIVEDILFKIPLIKKPLVGTPKEVQEELDNVVLEMQKSPDSKQSDYEYERILVYMHSYLVNVVLRQFPYIRGMDHSDTYQEALIALRFKAIPNFKIGKGMSFLNFAKMCIRRHLITILNASKNRQRDQSINRAVSLDSQFSPDDDCPNNTFANLIPDDKPSVDEATEQKEAVEVTKNTLMDSLSDFEQMVLEEYLTNSSYKEIGKNITERVGESYASLDTEGRVKRNKAVDNALWRIRKKAIKLKASSDGEGLPLFMKK